MVDEKNEVNPYRSKIEGLLSKITSGEAPKPTQPVETKPEPVKEPSTYEKMKKMEGGIKAGLQELFKLEESTFDVPHYISEEDSDQIVGTSLFRVKPPSNYPDADEYWKRVSPLLKRIGRIVPHVGHGVGCLDMEVTTSKGKEDVLRVQLVRDESQGDKPTLTFEFMKGEDITPEDVFKFIGRVGLRADRVNAKQLHGVIVLDVLEK